ncbi:MAG: 1-acyl-sn-glycerol-3-phosphate acyltransferase [Novosphingobium sp.]|nr:1-acyl-sn-glycerol-3-phosphate acyltransferase [Novosphingobium sp.]
MASRSIARADAAQLRAWARIAAIVAALAVLIIPHIVWRVFDRKSPIAGLFLFLAAKIAGADVHVQGKPIRQGVLYIANHVSWLDILALAGASRCAFVAKADMKPWPLIGWLTTRNNTVYVERESRQTAHHQATALQTALLTGQPVTLFPEGTTGDGRQLLAFRTSLIAAVTPAPEQISIQPVAIDYAANAADIAWVGDEAFGANALRILGRRGRFPVTLHFLEPLAHADFSDRKAIAAHSRAEIAAALGVS